MSASLGMILFYAALGVTIGVFLSRANMCMMRTASLVASGEVSALWPLLVVFAVGALVTAISQRVGLADPAPWTWPTWTTILGAFLIGLGARLNFACSIGTMGRLASGDLGGLATIAGAVLAMVVMPHATLPTQRPDYAGTAQMGWTVAILVGTLILVTIAWRSGRLQRLGTAIILGATTSLFYGWWTRVNLADMAKGVQIPHPLWMAAAIAVPGVIVGAIVAMRFSGRWRVQFPRRERLLPEFAGGALMGAGAHLLPGASDTLVFYSVPSGSPHGIIVWIIMFGTIILSFRVAPVEFAREPVLARHLPVPGNAPAPTSRSAAQS